MAQQQQQNQHQFDLEWLLLPQETLRCHVVKRTIHKSDKNNKNSNNNDTTTGSAARDVFTQEQNEQKKAKKKNAATSSSSKNKEEEEDNIHRLPRPPQWLNVTFSYTLFVSSASSQDILYGYEDFLDRFNAKQIAKSAAAGGGQQPQLIEHSSDMFAEYTTKVYDNNHSADNNERAANGLAKRKATDGGKPQPNGFFLKRVEHQGPINTTTGVTTLVQGLEVGLQTMEEGERALIEIPLTDMSFGEFAFTEAQGDDAESADKKSSKNNSNLDSQNVMMPSRVYDHLSKYYNQHGGQSASVKQQYLQRYHSKNTTDTNKGSSKSNSGIDGALPPFVNHNEGDPYPYTIWFDVTVGGSTSGQRLSEDVIKFTQHSNTTGGEGNDASSAAAAAANNNSSNATATNEIMNRYGATSCDVAIRAAHDLTGGKGTMKQRQDVTIGGLETTIDEDLVLMSMALGEMATVFIARREHLFMMRAIRSSSALASASASGGDGNSSSSTTLPHYPVREVILTSSSSSTSGGNNNKHVDPLADGNSSNNQHSLRHPSSCFLGYDSAEEEEEEADNKKGESGEQQHNSNSSDNDKKKSKKKEISSDIDLDIDLDDDDEDDAAAAGRKSSSSSSSTSRTKKTKTGADSKSGGVSTEALLFFIASQLKEDPSYIYDFTHHNHQSSSSAKNNNSNNNTIHKKYYNHHNIDFIFSSSSGSGKSSSKKNNSNSNDVETMIKDRIKAAEALKEHATKLMRKKYNAKAITNYCRAAVVLLAQPSLLSLLGSDDSSSSSTAAVTAAANIDEHVRKEYLLHTKYLLTVLCANVGRNLEILGQYGRGVRWASRAILLSSSVAASTGAAATDEDAAAVATTGATGGDTSIVFDASTTTSSYPKAYFLRAQLYRHMKKFAAARRDLEFLMTMGTTAAQQQQEAAAGGGGSPGKSARQSSASNKQQGTGTAQAGSSSTSLSMSLSQSLASFQQQASSPSGIDISAVSFELARLNEAEESSRSTV